MLSQIISLALLTLPTLVYPVEVCDEKKYTFWDSREDRLYWEYPENQLDYKEYTPGAQYLSAFAGRAEFPFLVDIRAINEDEVNWAIGSLVTAMAVMTSCEAALHIFSIANVTRGLVKYMRRRKNRKVGVRITYAPQYLWEDMYEEVMHIETNLPRWDVNPFSAENRISGARISSEMLAHKDCSGSPPEQFHGGVAYILLEDPIYAVPPRLNFVRLPLDLKLHSINKEEEYYNAADLGVIDQRICYVATYGRNYINWEAERIQDYKLRYRVYRLLREECLEISSRTLFHCERDPHPPYYDPFCTQWREEPDKFFCFQVRTRVGTICYRDRGAPIICDGKMYAMVLIGAERDFCNDLIQIPFVAIRVSAFRGLYWSFLSTNLSVPREYVSPHKVYLSANCGHSVYSQWSVLVGTLTLFVEMLKQLKGL